MPSSRFPPFDNSLSEDEEVVQSFVECLQQKIDGKIFSPNDKEGKIVKDAILYPGAYVGSVCAIAAFAGLRRAPVYVANRMIARSHMKNPNASGKVPQVEETPFARIVGSFFDAAMASLVGFATWTACINKEKTLMTIADIPLIEGKSDISDKLCGDFQRIYSTIRPQFWEEYSDDTLTAIQRFVQNCEKRQVYESRIRRDMGLSFGEDGGPSIELPDRVPDDILQEDSEISHSWTEMEDFDEDQDFDSDDDGFWDGK